MKETRILLLFLVMYISSSLADDFYELLGVTREADAKEIRKAFKKLALSMHPDKNQDDPDANEKFVRINQAYEVLKDEDLRKKYDQFGEDGLKDNRPSGQRYHSWGFYRNDFGIYDDDPEIVTLDSTSFDDTISRETEVWFVNFYSPQCSHCHDLAPTWRELARELEGVIHIGAVNCGDDIFLCRQQQIQGYPTLMLYQPGKQRIHFTDEKSISKLRKFVLQFFRAKVIELSSATWAKMKSSKAGEGNPWLISFCGDGGDCMQKSTARKVAGMLDDLVNVAEVNCHTDEKFCEKFQISYGTHFFPAGNVKAGTNKEIISLDAKEIVHAVLDMLPDMEMLNEESFNDVLSKLQKQQTTSWLVHFVQSSSHDLDLRKLPAMLSATQLGRLDCRDHPNICDNHHIYSFPKFVLFKPGGSYEIHIGRQSASDIAAFAQQSIKSSVTVLGPSDFPEVTQSGENWFIDFFSPRCPPCLRLLPQFRKASTHYENKIKFGTVDCTVHHHLCNQYNIHSYPTTVFYNGTDPHEFSGDHTVNDLLEFIKDILNPPVPTLNDRDFQDQVRSRDPDTIFLVEFYAPWCGPCKQVAPLWRNAAKVLKKKENVFVGQVNCAESSNLCNLENIQGYPTLRMYPSRKHNPNTGFLVFQGWYWNTANIIHWTEEHLPKFAINLDPNGFHYQMLKSSEPWILDFYAPWCGPCRAFAPVFEMIAKEMNGRVKAGKVDCQRYHPLCRQSGISSYPSIRYYEAGHSKNQYGEVINSQNQYEILQFLNRKLQALKNKRDEL